MNYNLIINNLKSNRDIFRTLLFHLPETEYLWRPEPDKWNLLEIICHLYDEEREDFRQRLIYVLEKPGHPLPNINPSGWVKSRNYISKNFDDMLDNFCQERESSILWLNSLDAPDMTKAYIHPEYGAMTAKMFLTNWLAHDYLHIRQIIKLKFDFLKSISGESLIYAGDW
jgi:hypothetical protein